MPKLFTLMKVRTWIFGLKVSKNLSLSLSLCLFLTFISCLIKRANTRPRSLCVASIVRALKISIYFSIVRDKWLHVQPSRSGKLSIFLEIMDFIAGSNTWIREYMECLTGSKLQLDPLIHIQLCYKHKYSTHSFATKHARGAFHLMKCLQLLWHWIQIFNIVTRMW